MRKALVFAGIFLPLLTACRDSLGEHGVPTAPGPSRAPSEQANALNPASVGQDLWAQLSPADRNAAMRLIEREHAAQGAVYVRGQIAIIQGDLPDGAPALLIRDPAFPDQPLLVLSELTMDDVAIPSAIAAFSKDAVHTPNPAERRVLRVTAGRHVVRETDGDGPVVTRATPPSRSGRALAERLYARATSVTDIDIPTIGKARLLRFD